MDTAENSNFPPAEHLAQRFVAARLNALAMADYPGPMPPDLTSAYAVQDAAIAHWPDELVGWKVGKIPDPLQEKLGCHRMSGPIFRRGLHIVADDSEVVCGVFEGGSTCFEAEYVFEVAKDAPADKMTYTIAEADALAGRLFAGVEMAGSPLAHINDLGPCCVVSDFGNNADEILGREIPDWRALKWEDLSVEAFVDGVKVGEGGPLKIPGTPLESLQFIAENTARRGKPLKKGMLISTGAATGVHDIVSGQVALADFKGIQSLRIRTIKRQVEVR